MKTNSLLLLLLFLAQFLVALKSNPKIPDSLLHKNYDYLDQRIYDLRKNPSKATVYIDTYIEKAKREGNWTELVNGYQNALHQSPEKLKLVYADSMTTIAKKTKDNAFCEKSRTN